MKPKITAITVVSCLKPELSNPFVSVFFSRGNGQSNDTHFDPSPASLRRVMKWQAITLLVQRKTEARR